MDGESPACDILETVIADVDEEDFAQQDAVDFEQMRETLQQILQGNIDRYEKS